jgi:tetratricopeptide (TPR) repeat protein
LFVPRQTGRGAELAVQLVAAATQAQLWITSYKPDSANLADIDNDVVARVTHALLGPGADLALTGHSARARREGAHGEYLDGKLALRRRTPEGLAAAIRSFESAVRLDSAHGDALGRLAIALALQLSYGYRTTMGSYPTAARALALAERAVGFDPSNGEPLGFRAFIEYLTYAPLQLVKSDFQRAIAMRPAEADVAGWHALVLLREGRAEESLAESRRALDLDPVSSARHLTYALAALGARRYELAALEARSASEIEPDLRRPRQVEGLALLLQNRAAECAALDLRPYLGVRAMCLRGAGRVREAQAVLDSLTRLAGAPAADTQGRYSDVIPVQELAIFHAWTGNPAETLRYLRLAFERSPVGVDQRIVQSAVFDRVRGATGFAAELQRIQDAVWPRVLEERQRLDGSGEATPLAGGVPAIELAGVGLAHSFVAGVRVRRWDRIF